MEKKQGKGALQAGCWGLLVIKQWILEKKVNRNMRRSSNVSGINMSGMKNVVRSLTPSHSPKSFFQATRASSHIRIAAYIDT
jgi:hypothetical protein